MGNRRHLRPRPLLHPALALAGMAVMRLEPALDGKLDEHGHDVLELAWIERGAVDHHLDLQCLPGAAGSLLVIPVKRVHRYVVTKPGTVLWNLLIDTERAPAAHLPRPLDRYLSSLLPAPGGGAVLVEGLDLAAILGGMLTEQEARAQAWPQAMVMHLRLLLLFAARAMHAGRMRQLPGGDQRMEDLRRRLDERPERAWNLRGMAREVGLGVPGLVRAFRRHTERTPIAYLRQARLRVAQEMLDQGADLAAAAEATGYSSASALVRARRHSGRGQ